MFSRICFVLKSFNVYIGHKCGKYITTGNNRIQILNFLNLQGKTFFLKRLEQYRDDKNSRKVLWSPYPHKMF